MKYDQPYGISPVIRRCGVSRIYVFRRPKLFRLYAADQKGIAALEFALIAPIIIGLLFGILNFGHAMYRYNEMQHVANETNRVISYSEITDTEALQFAREQLGASFSDGMTFKIERHEDEYRVLEFTGPTSLMTLVDIPYTALEHFKPDFQVKSVSPEYKTSSFAKGR